MKVCIYGVGAVGGLIGARLADQGCSVSAVARGATLEALRARGLGVSEGGTVATFPVEARENPADLGVQDIVVVAVKSQSIPEVAGRIGPLVGPDTIVLPAMNGVPWWFFQGFGGRLEGTVLDSVDPGSLMARAVPAANVLGAVVHFSVSSPEPGLVAPGPGRRIIVGEPSGEASGRAGSVSALFERSGFDSPVSTRIQADVWYKLWGNMTMNPITAFTGATTDRILDDPLLARFCLDAMAEAKRIGEAIGCRIEQTGEERNAVTRSLGSTKTSMQRDAEAGRSLELDAIVDAVREIGRLVGEPTPTIDILFGLARMFARERGLYPR
jgi:2-dehydropantoate 2-reductase